MRALVSQDRIRFRENGFDLDLTYITGQIIGSPHTHTHKYTHTLTYSHVQQQNFPQSADASHLLNVFSTTAMGVPGVGIESSFRNPEDEVARFFQQRHKGHFMIYNLACEKSYDYAKFDDQVIAIGWPDHHAPPLHILFQLCQSLHSWLGADPKNVAAVHCKAGKVRVVVVSS